MMKWLLIADLHLYKPRLLVQSQTIDWFLTIIGQEKPQHVVLLGDSFHSRSQICIETQQVFRQFILSVSDLPWKPTIHCLVGNHDMSNRFDRTVNSPSLFEDVNRNVFVYSSITERKLDDHDVIFIPYHENQNDIREYISTCNSPSNKIIFAHVAVDGTRVNGISDNSNNICANSNLSLPLLQQFKRVFAGHFHHHAVYGNFMYVGSPLMYSFSDAGQPDRGCVVYDPDANEWTLHVNPYAVQFLELTHADAQATSTDLTGQNVRIILNDNMDDVSELEKRLFSLGAENVRFKCVQTQATIRQPSYPEETNDLGTMVNEYLSSQQLDPDKVRKLTEKCFTWCQDIGALLDNNRFRGHIVRVVTHNFLDIPGTRNFDYHTLHPGLYYLQGSNGAGKTTLYEAISYCLFDKVRCSVNHVINNKAKDQLLWVSVFFATGHIVTRKRHKGTPSLHVQCPDGSTIERGKISDTEKDLHHLMNINWKTFERLTMLRGQSILTFFSSSDKDKHDIVEKLFGLDVQALHERCKDESKKLGDTISENTILLKDFTSKRDGWQDKVDAQKQKVEMEKSRISSYEEKISSISSSHDNLQAHLIELSQHQHILQDKTSNYLVNKDVLQQEIQERTRILNDLQSAHALIVQERDLYNDQTSHLIQDLNALETTIETLKETIASRQTELEELSEPHGKVRLEIEDCRHQLEENKYAHTSVKEDMKTCDTNISKLRDELSCIIQEEAVVSNKVTMKTLENEAHEKNIDMQLTGMSTMMENLISQIDHLETTRNDIKRKLSKLQRTSASQDELLSILTERQLQIKGIHEKMEAMMKDKTDSSKTFDDKQKSLSNKIARNRSRAVELQTQLEDHERVIITKQQKLQEQMDTHNKIGKLEMDLKELHQKRQQSKNDFELSKIRAAAQTIRLEMENDTLMRRLETEVELPLQAYIEKNSKVIVDFVKIDVEMERLQRELNTATDLVTTKKESVMKHLQEYKNCASVEHKRLAKLKSRLKDLNKDLTTLQEEKEETQSEHLQTRDKLDAQMQAVQVDKNKASEEVRGAEDGLLGISLNNEMDQIQSSIKALQDKLAKEKLHHDQRMTEKRILPHIDIPYMQERLQNIKVSKQSTQDKLEKLLHQRQSLEDESSECDTRYHTYDKRIHELTLQLTDTETKMNLIRDEVKELEMEKTVHTESASKLSKTIEKRKERDFVEPERKLIERMKTEKDKMQVLQDEMSVLLDQLQNLQHDINVTQRHTLETKQEMVVLNNMQSQNEALRMDSSSRIVAMEEDLVHYVNEKDKATALVSIQEEKITKYKDAKSVSDFWKQATSQGSGAFRQFCLQRARQMINSRLQEVMETFNEGQVSNLKCFLNDKLVIEHQGRHAVPFDQRSGGEQKMTLLAVIFTIMELIIRNCGFETNILFLDEIFDALDVQAIYMVEKWISDFTLKKPDLRTFLITHNEVTAAGRSVGFIRARKDRIMRSTYKAVVHAVGEVKFSYSGNN